MQNNIKEILEENPFIPVATINSAAEVEVIYQKLVQQNIYCIEITLRTSFAWEAVELFKKKYGHEFKVGVGTVIDIGQINKSVEQNVDFIVSPGFINSMVQPLENCSIPFLVGVSTPSEIMRALSLNWNYLKFFPANLFGGVNALKAYASVFPSIYFCPTGGINDSNYKEYQSLSNVISIGGSWFLK